MAAQQVEKRTSLKTLNNSQEAGKPSIVKQRAPSATYALYYTVIRSCYRKAMVDRQKEDEMAFVVNTDALIYPFP
jgi:hypothetical protein